MGRTADFEVLDAANRADRDIRFQRDMLLSAPDAGALRLSGSDGERFLRIISQTSRIKRHYELFQLMQGEVQYFIPHQILISAWGDFRGPNLKLDVISAIPGVRTRELEGCKKNSFFRNIYALWVSHHRQPLLLEDLAGHDLMHCDGDRRLVAALQGMESFLVHGIHDAREEVDNLYVAANIRSIVAEDDVERFRRLVDPVIAQIDLAFRRVAGYRESSPSGSVLSAREQEILAWISEGRTNFEISAILAISAFTVKNHVQRIIRKLGAANRTEAAARYYQMDAQARRKTRVSGATRITAQAVSAE